MKICDICRIPGPNKYHDQPVLRMRLDLEQLKDLKSNDPPAFNYQLLCALPHLRRHTCTSQTAGEFIEAIYNGSNFEHVLEHVILELSFQTSVPVRLISYFVNYDSRYLDFVVDYSKEDSMRALLTTAVDLVDGLTKWKIIPYSERIDEIKRLGAA